MNVPLGIVVLGFGSFHGDDCIGWRVIDRLIAADIKGIRCAKGQTPIDIIDFLPEASRLLVVDAAAGMDSGSLICQLSYGDASDRAMVNELPALGTHGIGICQALQVAQSLGIRTDHVTIWMAKGESFRPIDSLSETGKKSINACSRAIIRELTSLSQ